MTEIHNVINWKKINLYIIMAFGFCWTIALIMKLAHIEYGSTISFIIIGGLYMPGPAIATFIIQKSIPIISMALRKMHSGVGLASSTVTLNCHLNLPYS